MVSAHSWHLPFFTDETNYGYTKILILFLLGFFIRYASAGKLRKFHTKRRIDGKTVIITGANQGIGKETAKYLAKLGGRIILACRNTEAANKTRKELIAATENVNIFVKKLDLSSFKSIREFASDIIRTEQKLDILIHNAGYANTFQKAVSEDGIELTMATNHYGPFLLTHLLIDLMKKTEDSRIVVVSSSLYMFARMNLNNLNPKNTLPGYLYYVSKNANIMFTMELAKRLAGTGVTANCLHPGLVNTGIWDSPPFPISIGIWLSRKLFFKTAEEGCQNTVFCAVSEELDGVSGKYYEYHREVKLSKRLLDEKTNATFWDASAQMVKLTEDDPQI